MTENATTTIKLFPKQITAMKLLADHRWQGEVMYGGGARGGKSFLSCNWLVSSSIKYPGSQWLLGFEELKHLRRTTLPDLINVIRLYTEPHNQENWKNTFKLDLRDMVIEFINGSKIFLSELADLPSDPNFDRLGSLSLTGFAVDESQRVKKMAIDTLQARLSLTSKNGWTFAPKALYTCNPKKNWTYRVFWKPLVKEKKKIDNKRFITSLYTDNPYINHKQYKNQILNSKNKIQIQRLLNGNFEYEDDDNSLFDYDKIQDLFSNTIPFQKNKYLTIDVARKGKDVTTIYLWRGWDVVERDEIKKDTLDNQLKFIERLRQKENIGKSNVIADEGGVGGGIVDFGGYKGFVSNATPIVEYEDTLKDKQEQRQTSNYKNLKTQCVYVLAKKVNDGEMAISVNLTDDIKDKITEDLGSYKADNIDADKPLSVIPKDRQKEILGRSPDDGDALLMRSYFELKTTIDVESYMEGLSNF